MAAVTPTPVGLVDDATKLSPQTTNETPALVGENHRALRSLTRIGLCVLHVVCVGYFLVAGMLYYNVLRASTLANMLDLYSLTVHGSYFGSVGIVHFVFAGLHLIMLVSVTAWTTVLPRRILRQTANRKLSLDSSIVRHVGSLATIALQRWTPTWARHVLHTLHSMYAAVFGRDGVLGVDNIHFDSIFLGKEVVETALQTHQAYQMSRLLPRAWLNNTYATLLVLSCWSTPLLHCVLHRNPRLRRLLCLVVDIVLDFVSAVGVPVALALEYSNDFDPVMGNFATHLWYDDVWFVRFVNDTPVILLGSSVDAVGRLFFSLSMLVSLADVHALLQPSVVTSPRQRIGAVSSDRSTSKPTQSRRTQTVALLAHGLMAAIGVVVLSGHIHAATKTTQPFCMLPVRPWFVAKSSCALIELNCHAASGLHRTQDLYFESVASLVDPRSLAYLVFRHCSQLEFSASLQMLHNLVGLKLYNASIASWGPEAALSQTHHPRLRFLYLVNVKFPDAALPPGLLAHDFPLLLVDIEIVQTNLNRLPDDLDMRWPKYINLFLEFNPFDQFPAVLTRMDVATLSLVGSGLSFLPLEALFMPHTGALLLSLNPLRVLPEMDTEPTRFTLDLLYLDSTNITTLPAWMTTEAFYTRTTVFLSGSPYCENTPSGPKIERFDALVRQPSPRMEDRCGDRFSTIQGLYPLDLDVRGLETW